MSEPNEGAPEGVTEDTSAADQAADKTQAQGDEQSGDDAAAATDDEGQAEQPKPKKSAQERIDELTRARREAERDRDFYREQALRNGNGQQPAQEAQQQQPQDGNDEPDPAEYDHGENDLRYVRDLARWEARQEFRALAESERQQERARTARQTFETRKAALFPQGEPEGLQQFLRIPTLPTAVIEIVGESDIGPKIADHLGANPAELRRLEGMNPIQQARELTRLEMRLAEPAKPTPKTATDAPEPPPQARGAGGRFQVAPDTDDFASFDKNYG
jgi:hypothetical protein